MMRVLTVRLDAPLMSFGGAAVDNLGVTQLFPAASLITGLLGNALGLDRTDAHRLTRLQQRLRYAVRRDRAGQRLDDYQTVDLGQSHLLPEVGGWTTWGRLATREGGNSKKTHQRYRAYLADAVYTVAVTLEPEDEAPDLVELARALDRPARPLFIGRKPCLPAAPLRLGIREANSLRAALEAEPRAHGADPGPLTAWWPESEGDDGLPLVVNDHRDWANQIHVGERIVIQGTLTPGEVAHD